MNIMKLVLVLLIQLYLVIVSGTAPHNSFYNAIDSVTFQHYSSIWKTQHSSWIGVKENEISCSGGVFFPVCIGDTQMGTNDVYHKPCSSYECIKQNSFSDCAPTPQDTLDYIPPPVVTSLTNSTICQPPTQDPILVAPYYGLDQGIPPYFNPLVAIPLKVYGILKANFGNRCNIISGAIVEAWQVDISALEAHVSHTKATVSNYAAVLRDISKRAKLETNPDGSFVFTTTVPPSYGPPRNIVFKVTAEGFQTLTTRIYFEEDWRLQQVKSHCTCSALIQQLQSSIKIV